MVDIDSETVTEFAMGTIALVLLLFIYLFKQDIGTYYLWLLEEVVSYIAGIFFILPVAHSIANKSLPREWVLLLISGIGIYVVYMPLFGLTFVEMIVEILETVIVITLISGIFLLFYNIAERKIPP